MGAGVQLIPIKKMRCKCGDSWDNSIVFLLFPLDSAVCNDGDKGYAVCRFPTAVFIADIGYNREKRRQHFHIAVGSGCSLCCVDFPAAEKWIVCCIAVAAVFVNNK